MGWKWEGSGCGYKRATEGILGVCKCSVSYLYQCQYPGCDVVLCIVLQVGILGKTGKGYAGFSGLFLITTCESTILWKYSFNFKNSTNSTQNTATSSYIDHLDFQCNEGELCGKLNEF